MRGSILVGAGGEVRGIHIGGGWRGSERSILVGEWRGSKGGPYWWGSGGEVRGVHIGGGVEGK